METNNTFKEIDLSSFEQSNSNWFELIKKDPILNGGLSLDSINEDFEAIHKAISHTPIAAKLPALTKLPFIGRLFKTNLWVKMAWFEWKLSSIFNSYDDNYQSLINSWILYNTHIDSITLKIATLTEHLSTTPRDNDEQKLYADSVSTLISALTWTKTRMLINLNTAKEIRIQMKLNRPIFSTIIDSLVIEKTGEIWLRAAQNSIDIMNKFIIKASNSMTEGTIAFSKEINKNKYSTVASDAFKNNMLKLQWAMRDISDLKARAVESNRHTLTGN